jgi:hypothetical protein
MCAAPLSSSCVGYSIKAKFTCSSSLLFPIHFTRSALLVEAPHRSTPSDAVDEPPCQAPSELPPRAQLHLLRACTVLKLPGEQAPERRAAGSESLAESGSISSTVSTRATPGTSLTKPVSTSPSPPAYRCRLPTAQLHRCGQRPVRSRRFRLCLKSVPHRFLVLLHPTLTPWPSASHRIQPPPRAVVPCLSCFAIGLPARAKPAQLVD